MAPLACATTQLLMGLAHRAAFTGPLARSAVKGMVTPQSRTLIRSFASQTGLAIDHAKKVLKGADAVAFDVDSTVICEEGIDRLADFLGQGKAVAELTASAMGGSVLFQDALKMRLDLIRPSKQNVADCLNNHPPQLSPGVSEFIGLLHKRGTHVYLVSGGFRLMIQPVADMLSIPHSRIYANTLLFHNDGTYKGFDPKEPTSRDKGKPAVMGMLKAEHKYTSVVMIGDGATDMQAKPPADTFIGYGGVAVRDKVQAGADWFVHDFTDLINIVK